MDDIMDSYSNYFNENIYRHPYFRSSFEARKESFRMNLPLNLTDDLLYIQDEPTNHYDYNTLNSGIYQENTEKIVDNLDNFANEIVAQIDKCISTAMKISPELLSNSNGNTNEIFLARKNLLLWIEKLANFQQSRQLYGTLNSGNFQYGSGQKISLDSSHFQSASEDTSPQSSVSRHPHLMNKNEQNVLSGYSQQYIYSHNEENLTSDVFYLNNDQKRYNLNEDDKYELSKKRKRENDEQFSSNSPYQPSQLSSTDIDESSISDEGVKKTKPIRRSRKPKPHIQVFKVNPSKSVPHSLILEKKNITGKVPSSLANTLAGAMMYSFDIKKDKKKQKKRTSSIGKFAPGPNLKLEDFTFLSILGTGTFGKVHLVLHRDTEQYYCMKVLHKKTVYKYKQIEHVQNEKHILSTVQHPGIVKLFGTFQCPNSLYFLMEYVPGGELFHYIRKFGKLPENVAKYYASELILTLEYMHSRNIVYRDLKPENILIDETGHTKLTDLGFAKHVEDKTWTMCGTPDYLAPEIIMGIGHNTAVDWWSLGILVFEMLAGYPPFTDEVTMKLFEKIREPEKLVMPEFFSPEAKDFIKQLLVVDPSRRLGTMHPDVCNIKLHPWFADINWQMIESRKVPGLLVPSLKSAGDTTNFGFQDNYHVSSIPNHLDITIPPDIERVFDSF